MVLTFTLVRPFWQTDAGNTDTQTDRLTEKMWNINLGIKRFF